jgi:hypothetical protein
MIAKKEESSSTDAESSKACIFISYSRRDMAFADRLDTALKARGFATLIDRSEIYAFEDWWRRIEALIAGADTIVFILSPDSLESKVALREVTHAAALSKRFAPVVWRQVDAQSVPDALSRLNYIYFDEPDQFESSIARLAEALETDIEWVRKHTEFGEAARRWSQAGEPGPRGLLLRSPSLEEAERWIASRPRGAPEPTETTRIFVARSRAVATRRRNILSAALGAGAIIAVGLAALANWQRVRAVEQEAIAQDARRVAEVQKHAADEQRKIALDRLLEARKNLVGSLVAQAEFNVARYDLVGALRNGLDAARTEDMFASERDARLSDESLRHVLAQDRLILHLRRNPPPWGSLFEFLDGHTLAYTAPRHDLLVLDLNKGHLAWRLDLAEIGEPEHMKFVSDAETLLISSGRKLAIVNTKNHGFRQILEFATNIQSLDVTEGGDVAVGLEGAVAHFSLIDDPIEIKTVALDGLQKGQKIKQVAFDKSTKLLYVVVADTFDDHAKVLEYEYPDGKFRTIAAADGKLLAGVQEISAYGGRDGAAIYFSRIANKLGIFDSSSGEASDLRPAMLAAWRAGGGEFMFPLGLHYLRDDVIGEHAQLFAISRSDSEAVVTIQVQLVSNGATLIGLHQVKYQLPHGFKPGYLDRCRVSADHGFLACLYSWAEKEGLLIWSLAENIVVPDAHTELVSAAERMLQRQTEPGSMFAPFEASVP